jgi:hypothetical protein
VTLEMLGSAKRKRRKVVKYFIRKKGWFGRTECCTIYAAVP